MSAPWMTYSLGTWVVDKQRDRLGELVGHGEIYTRLRPPGGGAEWDAAPESLRLATTDELREAGFRKRVSWIGPSVTLVYMPTQGEGAE
ncbi:hypothetical protein [Streptomyces sp. UNOC14_S4]|uniref:hypothetical protein n=1 Tax=Streptomyces sp. UNOC14_S4 TaxID=2872340 RepID=UPI001E363081|nr:hypothetical protein [Streptomyces sp. UNOC14_S4]MCC3770742.1 hypothetical protein [Streptomyces sp. UNOC14_S4]